MACRRSIVGSLAGVDGSESMRDWCREMGIDDLDEEEGAEANQEMETPKLNLEPDIQLQMRRLFSVYFDEYHDHHDGSSSSSSRRHANLFSSINGTMSWVYGFVTKHMPMPKTCLFVESCLRGIGQVFFQNNPVSGLLIAIGLFVQSTRVAVHGILALVCGNGTAYLLGMDRGLVRSGLFGYNSYLVGLALATFGSSQSYGGYSVAVALATLVFSSFSSVVFVVLGKLLVPYKSPPLTLPFNFVVLTYLLATAHMANVTTGPVRSPELPDYAYVPNSEDTSITAKDFFSGVLRGVGQVFLADNLVAGALVLAGLAVCSRISALAALFGSLLGAAVAVGTGVPGNAVASG
jgi:urea transporter